MAESRWGVVGNPEGVVKEIEIIHRLFLVIGMYCQASSSQFNESLNLPRCYLPGKVQTSAVIDDGLEII